MIYLTRGHKVVILQEGCEIERIGNVIIIISPDTPDVEFKYEGEQQAIISFNEILKKLENYSPAYGINI